MGILFSNRMWPSFQEGEMFPFTIELDDPLSNCFIYNPLAPEDDPQIIITVYTRTAEQEDELGITDMNVWLIQLKHLLNTLH